MKKLLTIAVAIMFVLGAGSVAFAQEEGDSFFSLSNVNLAVGYGSSFGEEGDTFTQASQYAVVQADLLEIDLFDSTSGLGAEVSFGGDLEYTIWSLNRADVPGTNGRVYGGGDAQLIRSADDGGAAADFDLRGVAGTRITGEDSVVAVSLEIYFAEDERPIAFALIVGF